MHEGYQNHQNLPSAAYCSGSVLFSSEHILPEPKPEPTQKNFELGDELKLNLLILFRKSPIWNFQCLVSGHFWCAEF